MKNINIRFPDDVHGAIKAAAERDRRSFNAEVIALAEEALSARVEQD